MLSWGKKKEEEAEPVTLLVIQEDAYNWPKIFEGVKTKAGRPVRVVQTGFRFLHVGPVDNYSREKRKRCSCVVGETTERDENNRRIHPGQLRPPMQLFPDMVLVRNEVYTPHEDHRNKLYGLMYAHVPSVNSLKSLYMFLERPIIQMELNRLRDENGDAFPVIDQVYCASSREFFYGLSFPAVAKVGAAHAGCGKMKVANHHDMEDFKSVLAMTEGKYCSIEPFLEGEYDLRIQYIAGKVRAYKRISVSGAWKTNTGSSICEPVEVTAKYKKWTDLAKDMFGGLEIFSVDAVHTRDGKDVILEVNGSSSGLFPDVADEDNKDIRDLVVKHLDTLA